MHRDDLRPESKGDNEEAERSSYQPDASDNAITPPLERTLILDLLIENALASRNPVEELHSLQGDSRFSYRSGQRDFCDTLWKVEQRHFDKLVSSSQYSKELIGALAHRGELFIQLNINHIPSPSISAWLQLACKELDYVNRLPEWGDLDTLLCSHALSLIEELLVNAPSEWSIYPSIQTTILQELEGLSDRFFRGEDLSVTPGEIERAALLSWLTLVKESYDDTLNREAVNLLPQLFEIWKVRDQRDESLEDESFDGETECEQEGEEDSVFLLEELNDWREIDQKELSDEHCAIDSTSEDCEWQEGFDLSEIQQWEGALTLTLQIAQSRIDLDDEFIQVLDTADIGSDLWQSAFDGLLVSSYAESISVVESLFDTAHEMPGAMRHIASVLDAPERIPHEFYYNPPDLLRNALLKEKPRVRIKIIRMISKYIAEENVFGNRNDTMAANFEDIVRNLRGLKRS